MDLIQKFLKRLDAKRQAAAQQVIDKIYARDFTTLDMKKLKGYKDLFRVRKGKMRIQFTIDEKGNVELQSIDFRNDNTY